MQEKDQEYQKKLAEKENLINELQEFHIRKVQKLEEKVLGSNRKRTMAVVKLAREKQQQKRQVTQALKKRDSSGSRSKK